jgi:cytochrome c-type biogenesis protein
MSLKIDRPSGVRLLFLFLIISSALFCNTIQGSSEDYALAPDIQAVDVNGKAVSLEDYKGQVVLLHITNIENPLCRECEHVLNVQTNELSNLSQKDSSLNIITLNIRKNPYSKDGRSLAESWWHANVSWPWVEDFEPYPYSGKYIGYSTIDGGFSNPTLLLIDKEGQVAGVYHVYQLGKGEIDGIQKADVLYAKMKSLEAGSFGEFEGKVSSHSVTYLGMFTLGILTSLSPCSVALLIAMFSYIMTTRRKDEYLRKNSSASGEGFMIGVAFTLGMAAVFFVVGLFLSDLGMFVRDARSFDLAAGLLMIVLGVNNIKPIGEIIEPVRSRMPSRNKGSEEVQTEKKGFMERVVGFSMGLFKYSAFIGAFSLGVFFALGWAPCAVSLVFPVLIWLISQDITPLAGGMMLFAFGVGHGVPVIPISTFSRAVGGQIGEKYISAGKWVTKIFGLAVIVIGLVFASRYFGFRLW